MQTIHEYVLDRLRTTKGNWPAVAAESGVSYRTLKKIAAGLIASPRVKHLEKLANYFRGQTA